MIGDKSHEPAVRRDRRFHAFEVGHAREMRFFERVGRCSRRPKHFPDRSSHEQRSSGYDPREPRPPRLQLRHTLRGRRSTQRFDGKRQIAGRLESPLDILFQASHKNPLQCQRTLPAGVAQRLWLFAQNCGHRFCGRLAFEGAFAGEHLVQHRTETENVRSGVARFAPHLLRRHVADSTHHHTRQSPRTR